MMYKAGPILPVSGTAQDESFFPVRITSALIANQYTFVEVWTTPGGMSLRLLPRISLPVTTMPD